MAHYFASETQLTDTVLTLPKADASHLIGSLRIHVDEPLRIVVDQHTVWDTVVTGVTKTSVSFRCWQRTPVPAPRYTLDLALCLTKHDAFCETLHHCTQLPFYRFIPLISEYSVPQISDKKLPEKHLRWRRILTQSSSQCERLVCPSIDNPQPLLPWVQTAHTHWQPYDCVLFCDETQPKQTLARLRPILATRVLVIVGPEGGFSDTERAALAQTSATGIALGPTIFKAPQAAFYAGAVLQHELENYPSP